MTNLSEITSENAVDIHRSHPAPPVETFELTQLAFSGVTLLLAITITCGNGLVIVAVCKYRELRTLANLLIVNLAVTDLIVGTLMLPLHAAIFLNHELRQSYLFCGLRYGVFITTFGASNVFIVGISLDRFIAIRMALRYTQIITRKRITVGVTFVWVYSLVLGFIPIFGLNTWDGMGIKPCDLFAYYYYEYLYFLLSHVFVLFITLCVIYGDIFRIARKKLREMQSVNVGIITDESTDEPLHDSHVQDKNMRSNIRAAKTIGLVVGAFVVCITPFVILTLVGMSMTTDMPEWLGVSRTAAALFMVINSAINPVIYHQKADFRNAFRKMVREMCCSRQQANETNGTVNHL